jgi:putative spermidine/putrescine transport system permease protein
MTASSTAMPSSRSRRDGIARTAERTTMLGLIACGTVLIFVPLVLTLYLSVFDEQLIMFPPRGYTLRWYPAIIPQFAGPLLTSVELATASMAGSLLLGVPAGIGLARYRFRGHGIVSTLLLAPLTVPGIALGLAIYCFAVLIEENTGVPLSGSIWPMVGAHLLITTPWVIRLCLAALTNHERDTEEAAASLGARPLTVIRRVTLPAMRQGIVAGALFAFIFSFGNLETTLFLISPGLTTLPIALLNYLEYHIDPLVAAVAVAQMVLVGGVLLLLDRYVKLGTVVQ